jgi:hypothetical protein
MAKRMFRVPMALVSIVDEDRQWFKSKQGLDACETPRNVSFCGHAILGDDIFLVTNALTTSALPTIRWWRAIQTSASTPAAVESRRWPEARHVMHH